MAASRPFADGDQAAQAPAPSSSYTAIPRLGGPTGAGLSSDSGTTSLNRPPVRLGWAIERYRADDFCRFA